MNELLTVKNVRGYIDESGVAYLNLEDVARGLGFTETAKSRNVTIRWRTIRGYLTEFRIATSCDDDLPEFIPENIFYKLCFKAKNNTARRFQDLVTDEVLPSIRKHGAYLTPEKIEQVLSDPDTIIALARQLKAERERVAQLTEENESLEIALNQSLQFYPVAKYNRIFQKGWTLKRCQEIGKILTAYCRTRSIEIRKCDTNDERFGKVNSYPLSVWNDFMAWEIEC